MNQVVSSFITLKCCHVRHYLNFDEIIDDGAVECPVCEKLLLIEHNGKVYEVGNVIIDRVR